MINYFEFFDFPTGFDIDLELLERKYLEIQKKFHPDNASSEEIEKSIFANEGHKILTDDFLRLCHLLELKGYRIIDEKDAVRPSIEILEKIMTIQEKVDSISNLNEKNSLKLDLKKTISLLMKQALKSLQSNKAEQSLQNAIEIKYLRKCLSDIRNKKL